MPPGRCRPDSGGASSRRAILARGAPRLTPATTSPSTWCWRRLGPGRAISRTPFRFDARHSPLADSAYKERHGPQSRLPDGPDRAHRYQGRFHLRAPARSAMARARRVLLHARQSLAARRQADRRGPQPHRRGQARATITGWRIRGPSTSPSSTWCISARTRRSTWPISPPRICSSACSRNTLVVNDPGSRAQRAREGLRARLSRPHAADPRHPLAGADPRLPRQAQGHRGEAALRQRRRGDLPHRAGRHQSQFADRADGHHASASRSWCSAIFPRCARATSASSWSTARSPAPSTACRRRTRRRSNLHVGGTAKPTTLTKRDKEICARLGPELKKRGLIFTGIDVIGDYLTEINVTSPTGIRQIAAVRRTRHRRHDLGRDREEVE